MKIWKGTQKQVKRILVAVVGTIVLLLGLLLVPYPGPGWLIVFSGLAILSIEFDRARRLLHYGRDRYAAWKGYVKRQPTYIQILLYAATAMVVVVSVWLLNGYGYISDWLNLGWNWLRSPLPFFY